MNIRISNENIANYVMFKLDKIDNDFTEQELNEIDELVIDYSEEEDSFFSLDEILNLKGLKTLTLRNGFIFNQDCIILSNLKYLNDITFDNCEFENADLTAYLNLESLSLINCKINSYSFVCTIESLRRLTIINGKVETNIINILKKLNYLQVSYSSLSDSDISIDTLEELYIDNTNINNFDFLKNLVNLKKISIDINQYNNNKKLFDELMNNDIEVLNENMVGFRGEV